MSEINDGGPAFPRDHAADGHNGMSLRDYFAAGALQSLAGPGFQSIESLEALIMIAGKNGRNLDDQLAVVSYRLADAMLKARLTRG